MARGAGQGSVGPQGLWEKGSSGAGASELTILERKKLRYLSSAAPLPSSPATPFSYGCRLSPLPKQVVGSEFDQHPKASWIILMSRYISEKSLQSPLYDTPLPALGSRPLRPSRAA